MQAIKVSLGSRNLTVQLDTVAHGKNDILDTKRHCNAMYEIHVAMQGSFEIYINNHVYELIAGQAILIAPGEYHNIKDASEDIVHFTIPFSMEKEYLPQLSHTKLKLSELSLTACTQIQKEKKEKKGFYQERLRALYTLLLSEVLGNASQSSGKKEKMLTIETDRRFAVIENFFERKYGECVTEQELAESLNLSRRQLNRVLRAHYGMCFRDMLRHTRMDRAAWLLDTTNMPVGKISEECGYMSETSFFKAFKAHYGVSPMKYRKSK